MGTADAIFNTCQGRQLIGIVAPDPGKSLPSRWNILNKRQLIYQYPIYYLYVLSCVLYTKFSAIKNHEQYIQKSAESINHDGSWTSTLPERKGAETSFKNNLDKLE